MVQQCFFIAGKTHKVVLNFSLDPLTIAEWYKHGTLKNVQFIERDKWP